MSARWPLFDRVPLLAALPRVDLRARPTPVESLAALRDNLWIKRDDLTAPDFGGNKVRSLEFLLGGVAARDRVATVGPDGSTHALATAFYGARLGAHVAVGAWHQDRNEMANAVADEMQRAPEHPLAFGNPAIALPWLWWRRMRGDRAIPSGGTSPLGMLGHVNAGLELADQIERGEIEKPDFVVVPLGSGGTAAGLTIGLRMANVDATVVAARVVPRIIGRVARLRRLARAVADLIERRGGVTIRTDDLDVRVVDDVYGGAYGRPLPRAESHARRLEEATGIRLDPTYTAKAFTAAMELDPSKRTLFWCTFDSRWLSARPMFRS